MPPKKAKAPASRSPNDLDRIVGSNIRALRQSQNITLQALATEIGVSHQQLQKYETSANRLSAGMLPIVAEALGVEVSDLYFNEQCAKSDQHDEAARLRKECEGVIQRVKSKEVLASMARVLRAMAV
ncbi:DNA-binding protein [Hyphomonas neptunium ATCC 15444]|uniref:DNA-binding protein n=2 Tax=Hyphomonas TaxID=85 RepID=Q0BZ65_HYPNA|nr:MULTISPECIES: helix-turn-helix transcriptional regulator [Hyphomonas]ABI76487.1 DNA-binding protein [Hyphomonas neptunium ATCC 15444]KCZ95317.1 DNA-binding protein [Hyphomonas hirschiana VP5]